MADEVEKTSGEPAEDRPEPPRQRELTRPERALAGSIGALVVVAGFATLFFAKNDGAVAVAVAFVVGLVLLVMAVQGTPLIKVGGKDVSVELSPRDVVERAERIAATRSSAEAKGFIEGVSAVQPSAANDPALAEKVVELDSMNTWTRRALELAQNAIQGALPYSKAAFVRVNDTLLVDIEGTRFVVIPMYWPTNLRYVAVAGYDLHHLFPARSTTENDALLILTDFPLKQLSKMDPYSWIDGPVEAVELTGGLGPDSTEIAKAAQRLMAEIAPSKRQ